jgi:1,4-alpha-glucan branching enzyme
MREGDENLCVERGMALHKMSRLAVLATCGHGYLNFMGNEFGHPEWIDFPRAGNQWSYHYARRQWHLRDDPGLKYRFLADFDQAMIEAFRDGSVIEDAEPALLAIRRDDQVLAFERSGRLFLFNFHPTRSVTDYSVDAPAGEYRPLLSTDEPRFGGQGRVAVNQQIFTQPVSGCAPPRHRLQVYLPCRTALVLERRDGGAA